MASDGGVDILRLAEKFAPEVVYLRLAELERLVGQADTLAEAAEDLLAAIDEKYGDVLGFTTLRAALADYRDARKQT